MGRPQPPIVMSTDSSTGLGQIFARTAINAINWHNYINGTNESICFYNDRRERFEIWDRLRTDNEFNINMVALVLQHKAITDFGFNPMTDFSDEIKRILARYNGWGPAADRNGIELYVYFRIFETFNNSRGCE